MHSELFLHLIFQSNENFFELKIFSLACYALFRKNFDERAIKERKKSNKTRESSELDFHFT